MDVSKNSWTPNHPILIGFSIINHPFWGTTIFGKTHIHGRKLVERCFSSSLSRCKVIYDQEIDPKKAEEFSSFSVF